MKQSASRLISIHTCICRQAGRQAELQMDTHAQTHIQNIFSLHRDEHKHLQKNRLVTQIQTPWRVTAALLHNIKNQYRSEKDLSLAGIKS